MSSISTHVPTLQINENDLQNLICFIYKYERLLKEFGAIKIHPIISCQLALKKRRKTLVCRPGIQQIVKMSKDEGIYLVENVEHINESTQESSLIFDENNFWSSLSCFNNNQRQLNISLLPNTSFFHQKTSRLYFDIHRIPNQSVLKLGGRKVTCQFSPCMKRAHRPGAIFPLACAQQRLFLIDYHHEGGDHHWYIIPNSERERLQRIIDHQNSSICPDHGQLFIDPSVLDKNHIRHYRIIQHPNEFVVLSAGTLAQSFTKDAAWNESITFALPSWISDGHANTSPPFCQCNIPQEFLTKSIDVNLFRPELIQKYITSYLNITINDKSVVFKDSNRMDMFTTEKPNNIEINSSNDETTVSTNKKLRISQQSIVSSTQSPSASSLTSSFNSYFSEEDKKNVQVQYQILK